MPVSDEMATEAFQRGWAVTLGGRIAHFWIRKPGTNSARTACRPKKIIPVRLGNGQTGLFHSGDFPHCAQCARSR